MSVESLCLLEKPCGIYIQSMTQEQKLAELLSRLEKLANISAQQEIEIALLKKEIGALVSERLQPYATPVSDVAQVNVVQETIPANPVPVSEPEPMIRITAPDPILVSSSVSKPPSQPVGKDSLESFIGGNLINKIGILVLVIGVGIFVKYAIDNNLLGPVGRIICGYLAGLGLVGLAYRLKTNYLAYSAVLLSGGVATLYFTTYFAYDFYHLLPHLFAFALMVGVTGFTIYAAAAYNQQVIGVIGLVGAYAVPMLLSQHTGKVEVLFTYIAIINIGIAILAYQKKWLWMNVTAFVVTWLIFIVWFAWSGQEEHRLRMTLGFGGIFFLIFYAVFVFYHRPSDSSTTTHSTFITLNTFIFFWIGLVVIEDRGHPQNIATLFTLALAAVHGGVAGLLFQRKFPVSVLYLTIGLALLFLTIAIGIYFDGSMLTLVWALEGIMLCVLGYRLRSEFYVYAAGLVLMGGCISLVTSWEHAYRIPNLKGTTQVFLLNRYFLSGLVVIASLVSYAWLTERNTETPVAKGWRDISVTGVILLAIFLFYGSVALEITYLFNRKVATVSESLSFDSRIPVWEHQKYIWLFVFFASYVGVLVWFSRWYTQQIVWKTVAVVAGFVAVVYWFLVQQTDVEELRNLFLQHRASGTAMMLRYVVYAAVAGCLIGVYRLVTQVFERQSVMYTLLWIVIHFFAIAVLSFELRNGVMFSSSNPWQAGMLITKAGFSVLWGIYALGLVSTGIRLKTRLFRVLGIILLGLTLAKLFMRDLSYSSQLSKIIAFIGLGILLLVISFLYQRFKDVILADDEQKGGNV